MIADTLKRLTPREQPIAEPAEPSFAEESLESLRNGLIAALNMVLLALLFREVIGPAFASVNVQETVMSTLAKLLLFTLPYVSYIAGVIVAKRYVWKDNARALALALLSTALLFIVVSGIQFVFHQGAFSPRSSLQFTGVQTDEGILVESVEENGASAEADIRPGDVIIAIRRDAVTLSDLNRQIGQAQEGDAMRLRFIREGEELQATARIVREAQANLPDLLPYFGIALLFSVIVLIIPGRWTPYLILFTLLSPMLIGYVWVIIATFSFRTEGLFPLDAQDNIGGWTLENWESIIQGNIEGMTFNIWAITLNSLLIAVTMTVTILLVSSMAGYALSRMNFPGRRSFLSFTLILHGFPAVTLLIPIFFVLLNLAQIPLLGKLIGFNTIGGIALVMVAFQLPLGVWLMKGFFDNIPWDMERSALIDGASRWRTYWEILLPQIRPGLLALGIFAFISGWNAYIIPATYSIGSSVNNLPVFLNELNSETAPVDWNQVAAVGLFQLIPVFIFFIFAQEYLLNIYAGGTKGSS